MVRLRFVEPSIEEPASDRLDGDSTCGTREFSVLRREN